MPGAVEEHLHGTDVGTTDDRRRRGPGAQAEWCGLAFCTTAAASLGGPDDQQLGKEAPS